MNAAKKQQSRRQAERIAPYGQRKSQPRRSSYNRPLPDIGDPLRDVVAVGPWVVIGMLCVILAWAVSAPKVHRTLRDEE